MFLRRITVENVRSFLDRQELLLDGPLSIIVGSNGGGKTNLLDVLTIFVRKHLYASMQTPRLTDDAANPYKRRFQHNDVLDRLQFERHLLGNDKPQLVEVEVEVTSSDVENMRRIKTDAPRLIEAAKDSFVGHPLDRALKWTFNGIEPGVRFTYTWSGKALTPTGAAAEFLQFLNIFEADAIIRAELDKAPLPHPTFHLGPSRSSGLIESVSLGGGADPEDQKRSSDANYSRSYHPLVGLAFARLARKFRALEPEHGPKAKEMLLEDDALKNLSSLLSDLGYGWDIDCTDIMTNTYVLKLTKHGVPFRANTASSGEHELLTYLFTILMMNLREALIVIDEPELHLHPQWQRTLLKLFTKLAETTRNQFVLATHSPTFISPASIQYVSRVSIENRKSRIVRLKADELPDQRHLFGIVNAQNNERIFFADKVVLVEGLSDRIFFEAIMAHHQKDRPPIAITEIVDVGGKGFFAAYRQVLDACSIRHMTIADFDYLEQVGTDEIRPLAKEAIRDRRGTPPEIVAKLDRFIDEKRREGVVVLKKGAIEEYLPIGQQKKDVDALIRLTEDAAFWGSLPGDRQEELLEIVQAIKA